MTRHEVEPDILDDAARAGWLYYVGGKTQDEIAKTLGVSRQRAQRLVSKAVADKLVRVRLEHPISELMTLEAELKEKYNLKRVRVAPDIGVDGNLASVAPFAARILESVLNTSEPLIIGFGTGRALRATIEELTRMECDHHKLVSLIGNIAPDGTASFYDVIMRIADIVRAPHYPLPTPVIAKSKDEREIYSRLTAVAQVLDLAKNAHANFVGVGQMDETAPLLVDGFITKSEWKELQSLGVIGEIAGSIYDRDGSYIESEFTKRVTNARIFSHDDNISVAIASGKQKIIALQAALNGNLINALATDEPTARKLL